MNKEYCYGQDEVVVNTGATLDNRDCVDNIEDILTTENNIEVLENEIKALEHNLNEKIILRRDSKIIFNILASLGIIGGIVVAGMGIGTGLIMHALKISLTIIGVSGGMGIALVCLPVVSEGATKKNIEKIKSRISVSKYQLEQEEKILSNLKEKSKKTAAPKDKGIKQLSTTYHIMNLRNKICIAQKFKEVPNLFIDEYNNGTIDDVLGDLGSANMTDDNELVKYLIDEYQKEQIEKEKSEGYTKRRNKR